MHKQNEIKLCKVKGIVLNDVHAEVELWTVWVYTGRWSWRNRLESQAFTHFFSVPQRWLQWRALKTYSGRIIMNLLAPFYLFIILFSATECKSTITFISNSCYNKLSRNLRSINIWREFQMTEFNVELLRFHNKSLHSFLLRHFISSIWRKQVKTVYKVYIICLLKLVSSVSGIWEGRYKKKVEI